MQMLFGFVFIQILMLFWAVYLLNNAGLDFKDDKVQVKDQSYDFCSSLSSSDCDTDARRACEEGQPYNCPQPAKKCDPKPRTARRDANSNCFDISKKKVVLVDSLGQPLGVLLDSKVRLNFGVRRSDIDGRDRVMVCAARTDRGTLTGWLETGVIKQDLSFFPAAGPPDPGKAATEQWHVIVSDNSPFVDENGESYKVNPNVCESGQAASNYLGRANHTVNLIWNLPGTTPKMGSPTIDVFPNNGPRLVFYRLSSQKPVSRPLYQPCSKESPPKGEAQEISFLYGYIQAPDGKPRWGWMAMPNLEPGP